MTDAPVHKGATSQDAVDTAAMLVDQARARPAAPRPARGRRRRRATRRAAPRHADHRPHAAPARQPDDVRPQGRRLDARRSTRPPTLCTRPRSPCSSAGRSARSTPRPPGAISGSTTPLLPWHTLRGRIGELAGALGVAAGAVGKAALDVILLSQTEVGEVREGRGGGSTSMPHKHNPVAAVSALGCAKQAPGSSRRCSPRWCRSTSAPPAPGTASGAR